MKKYSYHSIVFLAALLVFVQCTTAYKATRNLKNMDELQYRDTIKKIHLPTSGYDIAYTDQGTGKSTIIFIHGLGSYLPAWDRNVKDLSQSYRCIAIDLPGYGKSSKQAHSGKMSFYAEILKELVQELNLGKVYLAGHSMGGQISMTTHLLYPELVQGLILVDPAGFEAFTKGQKQWFRDIMTVDGVRLTTAEAIQSNLASNFYRLPKEAEFMITDRMAMRSSSDFNAYCYAVVQSVSGMVNEPVLPYLSDIKCPTLILFGENDNLIPNRYLNPGRTLDIAKSGAEKINGSKLVMVPKAGHFMMFEKPEVFNAEVKSFLQ
jgi:pimeloyl-ACP methyl ester carboxylesterase